MDNINLLVYDKICEIFKLGNLLGNPKIVASKNKDGYIIVNMSGLLKQNKLSLKQFEDTLRNNFDNDMLVLSKITDTMALLELKPEYLLDKINKLLETKTLLTKLINKEKIVFDYSSPNIAKDMHVGHLRSTIIGDTLANLYEVLGHEVLRINHIGDFGLQFGMIINYIIENKLTDNISKLNLQEIYTNSKKLFDTDKKFNTKSYEMTVELQKQNPIILDLWKQICDSSKNLYQDIYNKLNIKNMIEQGESFYYQYFNDLIQELTDKNLLITEEGRKIIKTPSGILTVVKSDNGFTYDTTDLCALKYRLIHLKADRVYYVVDHGQSLHFKQLFWVAEQLNWKTNQIIEHISFGIIEGTDGKRIRSRSGGDNPKLKDLLNDAVNETITVFGQKKSELINDVKTIETIAFGSVKYADLSICRTSNYKFSFEKMLAYVGNTLTYNMYNYTRLKSIINKAGIANISNINKMDITEEDYKLIGFMIRLPEVLKQTEDTNMPNYICGYLYDLSELVSHSYNTQICITYNDKHEITNINTSRLLIFALVIQVMDILYSILNINTINKL
jgi:arginyl-tRNA synthetase